MIQVYCDGSVYYKSKLGGLGCYVLFPNQTEILFNKGYSQTTISRMELRAIIEALKILTPNKNNQIELYSDSQYCIKSINEWLENWKQFNYRNVKNFDLWSQFIELRKEFTNIKFIHVRGHKGVLGNEIVDLLADYKNFTEYEEDIIVKSLL